MVVHFFQRYALFFSILTAAVTRRIVLPDDAGIWASLAVGIAVGLIVFLLLYKDGVTANRPRKAAKSDLNSRLGDK